MNARLSAHSPKALTVEVHDNDGALCLAIMEGDLLTTFDVYARSLGELQQFGAKVTAAIRAAVETQRMAVA